MSRRVAIYTVASLALILHALHYATSWTDDAYITFRYLWNFANGRGMVFNEGEHLEGITNLGWALMLLPFSGMDLMIAAKILGLVLGLATVGVLAWWGRGMSSVGMAVMLAGVVLVPWVPMWTMQGLETAAVMFFVTLGWTRYGEEVVAGRGLPIAAFALGIAPFVRPDAALLVFAIAAWHVVRRGPILGRHVAISVGIVAIAAAILVGLKLAWFGEILPNTFHVKVGSWPPARGLAYLRNLLTVPSTLLPALLLAGLARGAVWIVRRDDRGLPTLLGIAGIAAIVAVDGDFMPNYRLLVPVWPALCAALGLAVDDFLARFAAERNSVATALSLAVAVSLVPELRTDAIDQPDRIHATDEMLMRPEVKLAPFYAPWRAKGWGGGLAALGSFPAAWTLVNAGPQAPVAFTDIGFIGYLNNEIPVIDLLGLTDRVMGRRDGQSGPEQWAYIGGRVAFLAVDTRGPLWARFRDALAAGGWKVRDGCDTTWVFANPAVGNTPPSEADLRARLDASLVRASHAYDAQVAIARELSSAHAPPEIVRDYVASIERLHPIPDDLRCEAGLGTEGCTVRRACESGGTRLDGSPEAARWPGLPPGTIVQSAPPILLSARPEDALGPPLDGPDPDIDAVPVPVGLPEHPAPAGPCPIAQESAAKAWAEAAETWAARPDARSDKARRLARVASRQARSDPGEALSGARAAADAARAAGDSPGAARSAQAMMLSEAAWSTCRPPPE